MKHVLLTASICAWLFVGEVGADGLSQQLLLLKQEGRDVVLAQEAAFFGLRPSDVPDIADPQLRGKFAERLASLRGLLDAKEGKVARGAPSLQSRAAELAMQVDPLAALAADPTLLMLTEGYRFSAKQGVELNSVVLQMVNPFGKPDKTGDCRPKDVKRLAGVPPIVSGQYLKEVTTNALPDPSDLPFSICFVVELRIGEGGRVHCSGALIGPSLVITARHCLMDNATPLSDGKSVEVRSVTGGATVKGMGQIWNSVESGYEDRRDVALLQLESPLVSGVTSVYGSVFPSARQTLWVLMAGVGVTETAAVVENDWNSGFVSHPQVVQFGGIDPTDRRSTIQWANAGPNPSSGCSGDSGGPVFSVGANQTPVIIGILTNAPAGSVPSTKDGCIKSTRGTFLNLSHPYVSKVLCAELQRRGYPCSADSLLPRAVAGTSENTSTALALLDR